MSTIYGVRPAIRADLDAIVAFTVRQAQESESVNLVVESVRRGVAAAFDDPPRARYWVAETNDGTIVASTSIVTEWSDFHGGDYWWVQSLFIEPAHRGTGLLARILDHLAEAALAADAIELRLYAHRDNQRAIRAYDRSGFAEAPYVIMQRELRVPGSVDA